MLGEPNVQNRGSSGIQELEITLEKELDINRDENKIKNLIQAQTGELSRDVWNVSIRNVKKVATNSDKLDSISNDSSKEKDFKDTILGNTMASVGKGISKQADKIRAEQQEKDAIEKAFISDKVSEISNIKLSNNPKELESQLSELIAYGTSIPTSRLPIRKVIYAKSYLALNKLKQSGNSTSIYEEQITSLKPKWYHSIAYFFATE